MAAPETFFLRSHDLAEISVPGCGRAPAAREPTARRRGPVQRLDLARQPVAVQLLHHRDGEGGDPRLPRRLERARRELRGVHRGGDKAFCTGGNTKEYAEYYAGRPQEYRQYMRLFNDMVSAILACDKPVICRVNGMRIGGGQEIGMACDFSVAQDLARFGQAGPARLGADRRRDRLPARRDRR